VIEGVGSGDGVSILSLKCTFKSWLNTVKAGCLPVEAVALRCDSFNYFVDRVYWLIIIVL